MLPIYAPLRVHSTGRAAQFLEERLERAVKTAARHGPVPRATVKGKPRKPTTPRSTHRP